ncbi:MAG: lactate racemase domain-containing protein [Spirochaetota bacterium]
MAPISSVHMSVNRGKQMGRTEINTIKEEHLRKQLSEAFEKYRFKNKKLLVIIPDNSRSAPVDIFFRLFYEEYLDRVKRLDYLVALGTHPLLKEAGKLKRVGIDKQQLETRYHDIAVFNHRWDKEETFVKIGTIEEGEMEALTGGLLKEEAEIEINRLIFEYDYVLILGPVFPHEIAGFSGSNKYLFPGIGGWKFIDVTHWLGALETNLNVIGKKDTAPRRLIDRAAGMVSVPIVYFNIVVDREGLKGLFIGDTADAWEKAVEVSSRINITYISRPCRRVLSIPSDKYEDFWTGAKAFYKIEPMVEDGGEVIVYAPHINQISITHGRLIEKIGFHIRDYFTAHLESYRDVPRAVMAYSSLVKGAGTYINGKEKPRVRVVLSSGVPEEKCRQLNLDYMDPGSIDVSAWENSQDEGVRVVHNSGEILFRVGESG